jgi:hypothetical protein
MVFAQRDLGKSQTTCPASPFPGRDSNTGPPDCHPLGRAVPLPSKFFPIHDSLIIISFDAALSELLTMSLNKPEINFTRCAALYFKYRQSYLYECQTWSFTLREGHWLRVSENRVLRRIFGPKMIEVTGSWRKFHNVELHNLYSSKYY